MLELPSFDFACPPFCCGEYFLKSCNVFENFEGGKYLPDIIVPFTKDRQKNRITVSLVCNPKTWLEKAFQSHLIFCQHPCPSVSEDYGDYLRCYLEYHAGTVTSIFKQFSADVVLRIEDCPAAIQSFLPSLGINTEGWSWKESEKHKPIYEYSHAELLKLFQAEEEIFDGFEYH